MKEKAIIEGDDDDDDTSGVDGEKSEHAKFLQAAGMDEGLDPTERLVDIYDRLDEVTSCVTLAHRLSRALFADPFVVVYYS